jgi:hypothetical protein
VYYNFIGLLFLAFVSESICVLPYCPTFPIVNCEAGMSEGTRSSGFAHFLASVN